MDRREIEHSLLALIDAFEHQLPSAQLQDMREEAKAGEPGLSLENLCTQIYEYDLTVSKNIFEAIRKLGRAMHLNSRYWEKLRVA